MEAATCSKAASAAEAAGWLVLGALDAPLPFEPSEGHGPDVTRAEQEMYRLYREVEKGEKDWLELQDLFSICDMDVVATGFMWAMYLKVIPTYYGFQREFGRLFFYSHDFDIRVLNVAMMRMLQFHDLDQAFKMWNRQFRKAQSLRVQPTVLTINLMLEALLTPDSQDLLPQREWWLDRGVSYVPLRYEPRPNYFYRQIHFLGRAFASHSTHQILNHTEAVIKTVDKHSIRPNLTTLYLLARVLPVHIDYGREMAGYLCHWMDTTPDEDVPMEARILITEFLHWKLEAMAVDPRMSVMRGPPLGMNQRMSIVFDDFLNMLSAPFRPPGWEPPR